MQLLAMPLQRLTKSTPAQTLETELMRAAEYLEMLAMMLT